MQAHNRPTTVNMGLVSLACGSVLAGVAAIAPARANDLIAQVNTCPGIFYEEPFNTTVAAPQGCPPNAFTGQSQPAVPVQPTVPGVEAQQLPAPEPGQTQVPMTTPPLQETLQEPIATIAPVNGNINIRLVNETGTAVTYQVIEDTDARTLPGNSEYTLQELGIPVTVTFTRPDGGLLSVTAQTIEPGVLNVTLDEAISLDQDRSSLIIQEAGGVFVN